MNWKTTETKRLLRAMLALQTQDEAKRFLRDLMTKTEIEEFAKRLQAAEMLTEKQPYIAIEQKTGLSSATVARVARWLNGPEGGYQLILKRLHHRSTVQPRRGLS